MSYDIMIFDSKKAPKDIDAFLEWEESCEDEIAEAIDSDEAKNSSKKLQAWFFEISKDIIPLTGQYSRENEIDYIEGEDDEIGADYFFCKHAIFLMFSTIETENLYKKVFESAKKHNLGFYDFDSEVIQFPK